MNHTYCLFLDSVYVNVLYTVTSQCILALHVMLPEFAYYIVALICCVIIKF